MSNISARMASALVWTRGDERLLLFTHLEDPTIGINVDDVESNLRASDTIYAVACLITTARPTLKRKWTGPLH